MDKVAIIGAGHVGATAGHVIAQRELADVVLVDIAGGVARGKSIDKMQAMAIHGSFVNITGTDDFAEIAGSDIVAVTAGFARGPGMSRADLLKKNAAVIESVIGQINAHAPDAIIIMVTNPLDDMTTYAKELSGRDRGKLFGMGGVLDSGRFTYFISKKLQVPPAAVQALVVGAHGDAMIPLVELATVNGRPLKELISPEELAELADNTRRGGAEIISHLQSGSAYYGPGTGVAKMVEAILRDTREVLPACVYLEGEYGIDGAAIGVPAKFGNAGMLEVVEVALTAGEAVALRQSAADVKAAVEALRAGAA
jgi:malate dehydrogenase